MPTAAAVDLEARAAAEREPHRPEPNRCPAARVQVERGPALQSAKHVHELTDPLVARPRATARLGDPRDAARELGDRQRPVVEPRECADELRRHSGGTGDRHHVHC
ncbi:MAG TPA: hypothetical protein VFL66_07660, partial [Gaiellaceae bacterium]|nr:hypothetical protein [Gaiellaceae bacterium]